MSGDPFWSDVVLLVPFDGSSTWLDNLSDSAHILTANGSFNFISAGGQFGDAGGRTGTSTASRATIPSSSDFNFPGAFTIELWNYRNAATAAVRGVCSKWQNTNGGRSWAMYWGASSGLRAELSNDGDTVDLLLNANTDTTIQTFRHLCLERNSSNFVRLYIDGAVVDSDTLSGALFDNSSIPLEIGGYNAGNGQSGDRFDEVRITNGVARYDGAFTPPDAPFPVGPPVTSTDAQVNQGGLYAAINSAAGGDAYVNQGGLFVPVTMDSAATEIMVNQGGLYVAFTPHTVPRMSEVGLPQNIPQVAPYHRIPFNWRA